MTAICALTLAVAVAARSPAAVTDVNLCLPCPAVAACCATAVFFATRPQRGMQ